MNDERFARFGDALLEAYETQQPTSPLTASEPDLTPQDAYGIQLHQVRAWKAAGRRVRGYKVGLTSKAMQRQLGVDQPDFGHLFDDMVLDGSAPIPTERFISPRVEPEISFVLGRELAGPGLTLPDVLEAVDYAVASIEIIDSRIADWRIGLADTIADNASSGALMLGSTPLAIDARDLGLIGCVLTRNGEVVGTGAGAAVLGHPLNGVLWLANTLGALGQPLEAGSIVMAGAVCAAVPAAPGDVVTASFAGLGSVSARFSDPQNTNA
ncbi:fumarylacetoacetate hydrolase family protein [Leucobacter sp. CSA1]|uniref:Fumarylacetoacetate hydrolase family protein n=1 Tax=Leucobacter chromiisoli TaxID=2796471 RepID=A0A934Q6Z7_9MICO|nr:2-keto-4-pentenoate hydratase [Leucobacter chromiisoli]MBK0418886.1 fumarylacetoacetate hydrolase family protein [Leucobacter chromiisoli]